MGRVKKDQHPDFLIEIVKWSSFQERRDTKSCSWFRMSHGMYLDPAWDDFSAEEMHVWAWILAYASFKNEQKVRIALKNSLYRTKVSAKVFMSAVSKLVDKGSILLEICAPTRAGHGPDTGRARAVNVPLQTDRQTDRVVDVPAEAVPSPLTQDVSAAAKKTKDRTAQQKAVAKQVAEAYKTSFENQHGFKPSFAARENKLVYTLIDRVGAEEAIRLAEIYPTYDPHRNKAHPFGFLVSDVDQIRAHFHRQTPREWPDGMPKDFVNDTPFTDEAVIDFFLRDQEREENQVDDIPEFFRNAYASRSSGGVNNA